MAVRASYESMFRRAKDYAAALVAAKRVRDVDELDRDGESLLGIAAYYGHADVCGWVLDQGGAVDIHGRVDGRTPLLKGLWALSGGANQDFILRAVRLLLDRGASVTAADEWGKTALHYAASYAEAPDLVAEVLDRGADPNVRTTTGQTPLMQAAESKNLAGVRALMAHGADPHARDGEGRDVLSYAAESPHYESRYRQWFDVVECFVDVADALNGDDGDLGQLLFVTAAYAGRLDVVERRLVDGVQPDVNHGSALLCAVEADDEALFDLLVQHGADLDAMLVTAARTGRAHGVERCLRAGADPNAADKAGERLALKYASDCAEPVRALLKDYGADLDTLLRYAAGRAGSTDTVGWCLAEGADPNTPDRDGATALHAAVSDNSAERVGLLLHHGADPTARDHQGRAPADLVRTGRLSMFDQIERDEIQQLLAAPAT